MDLILPYNTQDRVHFCDCAMKVGFHEFVALKVLYTMKDSDLDVFQLMARERLDIVLYGWELCQVHWDGLKNKDAIPPHLRTVLKQITQYSLDIWFSKEWEDCKPRSKAMLLVCLKRASSLLVQLATKETFDWDYTLKLGIKPWDIQYLKEFAACNSKLSEKLTQSSEHVEAPATAEDIKHLRAEGLTIMLLRLIKLFDAGFFEGVRRLSMRVIAAWNHEYEQCRFQTQIPYPEVNKQHKQCLILICHIYLMAVYEMDDIRGFVIDNLLNNIRFYYQNMVEEPILKTNFEDQLEYTPARYIAITCINLEISSQEFIDAFIYDSYDENFVSLFGVISQSYLSYLLANLLMEMNKMNEDDFNKRAEDFKRIIHLYIKERERSEEFILRELHKKELKRRSHTLSATKENLTNFYDKMCKGNRLSNIGSTEHTEDDDKRCVTAEEENERRVDPVFQHLPNNSDVLNYVYTVLVKRTHRGWYFAKLIVLLKIIGLQLNAIETWRYHPGLTPEFLLNLEVNLSRHFEDLAIIFQEHLFMEQEFWLTGFYLNPCKKYYETVIRSGMRSNRLSHRFETGENYDDDDRYNESGKRDRRDKGDKGENAINAKYGLLSSTIDVKEIVKLANHEAPDVDYGQLYKALRSFKLPDNTIKDLLTVIFLPRNKSFAWALSWVELRKRCKSLLRDSEQKRHFVELNMAEANDRLAFLKIDYEKYKHRPQLDYGSIEQGYEGTNMANFGKDSSDENEDEESEDFEADSDLDEPTAKHEYKKKDHALDSYFMSTRRTRARAAAVIDVLERSDYGEKVEGGKNSSETAEENLKKEGERKSDDATNEEVKRDFNDMMKERNVFDNSTSGFNPFPDIWSVNIEELKKVEEKLPHLEISSLFEKSAKLEMLKMKNAELIGQQHVKDNNEQEAINMREVEEVKDMLVEEVLVIGPQNVKDKNAPEGITMREVEDILVNDYQNVKDKNAQEAIAMTEVEEVEDVVVKTEYTLEEADMQKVTDSQPEKAEKCKNDSIADLDIPDDESDVSTTARRDSDEVNDLSKDEQMDQSGDAPPECLLVKENVTESPKITEETGTSEETEVAAKSPDNKKNNSDLNENEDEKVAKADVPEKTGNENDAKKFAKENVTEKTENENDAEKAVKENVTEETKNENETEKAIKETVTEEDRNENEAEKVAKETIIDKTENANKAEKVAKENVIEKPVNEIEAKKLVNDKITEKAVKEIKTEETDNGKETETDASDTETKPSSTQIEDLIKLFTRKKLRVRVRKLKVADVLKLRQPSVRLQRVDIQAAGNRLGSLRRGERKFYNDLDDSSKSSNGSLSGDQISLGALKRSLYHSESSSESEEFKKRRRVGRPTRGRGGSISAAAQPRPQREQTKSLKVTPRSASGLKFRISNKASAKSGANTSSASNDAANKSINNNAPIVDYIQISSSSSSEDEAQPFGQLEMFNEIEEMDINDDPLYEEEIPIFRI